MTQQNPSTIITDPTWRILVRNEWDPDEDGYTTLSAWTELPLRTEESSGFSVALVGRSTVAEMAEARFDYQYGIINGKLYNAPGTTGETVITWDPATGTLNIPDYEGYYVLIQRLVKREIINDQSVAFYTTAFAGRIAKVVDSGYAGATVPAGTITYIAKDMTYVLDDWKMDRHIYYYDSTDIFPDVVDDTNPGAPGHPGYNSQGEGRKLGNRITDDPSGFGFDAHCAPGAGDLWTDYSMLVHALASARRPDRQPPVTLTGDWSIFEETETVQQVNRNESVASFVRRLCDRRRGKGTVCLLPVDFAEEGAPATKTRIELVSRPQFLADLVYTKPDGGTKTIRGATTAGTTVDLDFLEDHRIGRNSQSTFVYDDDSLNKYDRLETIG